MAVEIGLGDEARASAVAALNVALADTYAVYFKTHGYHWNVTGMAFKPLHELFEEQYRDLWAALDEIAERLRALGDFAPATPARLAELTTIGADNDIPSAETMIANLISDHGALLRSVRSAFDAASGVGDEGSADLMVERMQASEKFAWMLRAHLGG
ncbi:MAG: Dps family protein [Maricaulaceae bacterium]